MRWPSDLGLPVTSQLLDSVMKSLRTGRTVRLWIDWDIPVLIHRADFPRAVARVLFRRRSRQLLSRLRRFRNFSGFCALWTSRSKSLMLQPTHHPEFLEFQRFLPDRISINVGGEIQMTSHHQLLRPVGRKATRSAMAVRRQQIASRACRSTNCVSKAVVDYPVHSNDALAKAIRLSGGSDEAIQAALRVRCAVCERLTEPSPVPAASRRR